MSVPALEMNAFCPLRTQPPGHPFGPGTQRADVRARARLGQPEGAELAPLRQRPQPALALVVVAEQQQREAADGGVRLPGGRDGRVDRAQRLQQSHVAHRGRPDPAPLLRDERAQQPEFAQAAQDFGRTALLVPGPRCDRGDLPLGVGAAKVKQFAFELGECEVHGPLALPLYTDWSVHDRNSWGDHRNEQPGRTSMTSHDDAAPVRLEPHPADERLAILRVDRPPVNAFDQRMWDQFDAGDGVPARRHVVPCGRDYRRTAALRGRGRRQGAARPRRPSSSTRATGCCSEPSTPWRRPRR